MPAHPQNEYVIPEIPEEIYAASVFLKNGQPTFDRLDFYDYSTVNSYQDYLDSRLIHPKALKMEPNEVLTTEIQQAPTTN